ncbi:MAG: OmpA family protein [Woeseia sp.]|nr:OmpA family protein [Woeseia sp.]MBT8095480.1 OmpA family protein [Woeseia sp.]NNE61031.1 OmpA family protein [Woeseia sp.]NNL55021.1 OmpA family protein [Woeseia sp.]
MPVASRVSDQLPEEDAFDRFAKACTEQFATALRNRRVDFKFNSSTLRSSAYPLLDTLIEIASDCAGSRIVITGHTDASGHPLHNQYLSEQRAAAVKKYMVARGVSADRLDVFGAGASELLDTGDSRAARARNRRIEFEFSMIGERR